MDGGTRSLGLLIVGLFPVLRGAGGDPKLVRCEPKAVAGVGFSAGRIGAGRPAASSSGAVDRMKSAKSLVESLLPRGSLAVKPLREDFKTGFC